jgi:hypothetical protein
METLFNGTGVDRSGVDEGVMLGEGGIGVKEIRRGVAVGVEDEVISVLKSEGVTSGSSDARGENGR